MAIQAARPVRPAIASRPVVAAAPAAAVAAAEPGAAPGAAPRPRVVPKAREGMERLKTWIMTRGAMVGAGFGLFFAGLAAFGNPFTGLMAAGLVAGVLVGAGVGAFIGGQLADLAIYSSGRAALLRRGPGY